MTNAPGHVSLLATGGTISAGPEGALGAQSLIRLAASSTHSIPADIPVRGEDIACVPSSCVTAESIAHLAKHIRAAISRPGCRGVVVTHGTDTLEEVAFACDLLVGETAKPIVFTGAMIPPKTRGTDAHMNLANAIRVAGATPPVFNGSIVVLQRGIHAAAEVHKLSTDSIDAFASPTLGPIGWVHADTIEHIREPSRFAIETTQLEPRVELITLTAGCGDRLIRAASAHARGLVVELFGMGNAPEPVSDAIRDAIDAGAIVLVCSRIGMGRFAPGSGVLGAGAIPTPLAGLKARVLLMAALGAGLDREGLFAIVQSALHSSG